MDLINLCGGIFFHSDLAKKKSVSNSFSQTRISCLVSDQNIVVEDYVIYTSPEVFGFLLVPLQLLASDRAFINVTIPAARTYPFFPD